MRKLLATSALVVPLLAMPGYAQDTQPPVEDPAAQQAQQPPPAADEGAATGADDANVEVIPAEEADVEVVQEGEEPAAGEDPAIAEDPALTADEPMNVEGETAREDEPAAPPSDAVVMEQGADELRGDWVMGTGVVSPQDETIGRIQDVIITPDGQITSAILSVGGFLGIGGKNIAVDWNELQIGQDGREITLNLTREQAEQAPEYVFRDQAQPEQPAGDMAPDGDGPVGTAPDGDPGTVPVDDPEAPAGTDPRSAPE